MEGRNRNPPWSDLPQELLSTIANTLTSNPISILTFRSICRSWRFSCPPLSNSSLLSPLLPLSIPLSPESYHLSYGYSHRSYLSVTIIYALHRPLGFSSFSPDTCILFVDEFTPGKLTIRKPFLNESYFTPINFPSNINLIDFNACELGRFHNRSYSTNYTDYDGGRRFKLSKPRFCVDKQNKVVMFPNTSAAISLADDGRLGMYRLDGISEEGECGIIECETKHDGKGFRFDDIVEFKGRVLGIDRRGKVYEIKYHSSEMTPFVAPIAGGGGRRKRLVESLGRLYLVVRCYVDPGHNNKLARLKIVGFNEERKMKFKVYELNEGRKKWIEISSLGDRSFCFGRNFSFSASVQDLGTCGNDCILFTKHSFLSYSWNEDDYKQFPKFEKGDLDICVYHLHNAEDFGAIESYPGYPDTLWPPPCWIWSIDRVKRIEIVETAINDILERIPENFKAEANRANSGGDPCDDFGKPVVLEFTRGILTLSKMAFDFQEEETKFMNKLRETTDMLNKADKLFELERTSPWVEHDAFKEGKACHGRVLRSILGMLRLRYAHLLYIEEQATQLEMSMNSHIARMLT